MYRVCTHVGIAFHPSISFLSHTLLSVLVRIFRPAYIKILYLLLWCDNGSKNIIYSQYFFFPNIHVYSTFSSSYRPLLLLTLHTHLCATVEEEQQSFLLIRFRISYVYSVVYIIKVHVHPESRESYILITMM